MSTDRPNDVPTEEEEARDWSRIAAHIDAGHTEHCAKRLVWGDGECECAENKSPYHTMNPPSNGWWEPLAGGRRSYRQGWTKAREGILP